jgi:hypothetical protein
LAGNYTSDYSDRGGQHRYFLPARVAFWEKMFERQEMVFPSHYFCSRRILFLNESITAKPVRPLNENNPWH